MTFDLLDFDNMGGHQALTCSNPSDPKGRMLRQSLSLKPSFKIRGNPIVSLRGSFWASWYAETRFIFKPSLK